MDEWKWKQDKYLLEDTRPEGRVPFLEFFGPLWPFHYEGKAPTDQECKMATAREAVLNFTWPKIPYMPFHNFAQPIYTTYVRVWLFNADTTGHELNGDNGNSLHVSRPSKTILHQYRHDCQEPNKFSFIEHLTATQYEFSSVCTWQSELISLVL